MRLFLHEFTEQVSVLNLSREATWLQDVLSQIDEKTELDRLRPTSPVRAVLGEFRFHRNDRTYFLNGELDTQIQLLCSRCGKIIKFPCRLEFHLLFSQNQEVQEMTEGDSIPVSADDDLDILFLDHDYIELGEIVREQILLMLPFHPLCQEDCHGLCAQCGADLNAERCRCPNRTAESQTTETTSPLALALGQHLKEKTRK